MAQEIEKIWPEWKVERRIGGGAYGTVYQIGRASCRERVCLYV